jgi:hypothetical protein
MTTFWRIITLRTPAYDAVKSDGLGFGTALRLFLAVGLFAALGQLLALQSVAQQKSIYEEMTSAAASLQARAEGRFLPQSIATPLSAAAQWLGELAQVLKAGQPPLGKTLSQSLIIIGGWLASPFSALAVWLPAAVLLFICAKLLRGSGSMREHLSLVLLAFAPQVLRIVGQFSLVPALKSVAGVLAVVAFFWSLAILILALMRAHGFSAGRSVGTLALAILFFVGAGAVTLLFWGALTALVIRLLT